MAIDERVYIRGKWRGTAESLGVFNPARPSELVGRIARAGAAEASAAIESAHEACSNWTAEGFAGRAHLLSAALRDMVLDVDAVARLYVRENGKILTEATPEIVRSLAAQQMVCRSAASFEGDDTERSHVDYLPFGVVVVIVPWNSPVAIALQNVVPALLAGNCVVLKPPETCPLALIQICGTLAERLPPGVLNIVTGLPQEIGLVLAQHPLVGKIVFTGSNASACAIARNAADRVRGYMLELGGNDAALILPDAKFDDAFADALIRASFRMAGQVCMAVKRVYVPAERTTELVEQLSRGLDEFVVGDGLCAATTMGPVHLAAAKVRAETLLQDAVKGGGLARTLGRLEGAAGESGGHFVLPTLVVDPNPNAPLVVEEQFCPILPIISYTGLDDALAQINGTDFGLGGSVWSENLRAAEVVARRIEAGVVFVNGHGIQKLDRTAPFGGLKQSGLGRSGGRTGLLEYLQTRTITICGE